MIDPNHTQAEPSRLARYLKIVLIICLIAAFHFGGTWFVHQMNFQLFPRHDSILNTIVLGAIFLYILLMAIPFMPGIEIGLALMFMLGNKGALLVYLCTLAALSISFVVGKTIPPRLVYRFLKWLHLSKASTLVYQLESLDQQERLKFLNEKMPTKAAPLLLNYRYLTIAAALNLPGNALIGGGGGISLVVGMSKIVPFHSFILLLAIAIAPVPLWFFLYGS
ncbi:MAG: hypothetical protein KBT66_00935 [Amphritea sp.]|nr:hypothetical protein [Amphritea sp.]MBQ0782772.1 hypothetical protein [Amphritea sp.]